MRQRDIILPVVLSGGSGTRLWPVSRERAPKQFASLLGDDRSLFQRTLARFADGDGYGPPIVICNEQHRFLVAEQMRRLALADAAVLLEPAGRNTAPAAALAALAALDRGERWAPDATAFVLLLPADHLIADEEAFHRAIATALPAARAGRIVTFGIAPDHPATGYGYIEAGAEVPGAPMVRAVRRFREKPDRETAAAYLEAGNFYWNAGIFLARADALIDEFARHAPEILARVRDAFAARREDPDFTRPEARAWKAARDISIDYAIMERTDRAAVVPVEMGWSDVGSWDALHEALPRDESGNALLGDVLAEDVSGSLLRTEGPMIAALGVKDLVVVATPDAVLVLPRARAQDVRRLVDRLKSSGRPEIRHHAGDGD